MLWIRYGLLKLRPWRSLNYVYDRFLESPGTKAYSYREAKELFKDFTELTIDSVLSHGDLLSSQAGQRHQGALLELARKVWPRSLIQRFFPKAGLFMLILAKKA